MKHKFILYGNPGRAIGALYACESCGEPKTPEVENRDCFDKLKPHIIAGDTAYEVEAEDLIEEINRHD
jgi:hypothetical protein